MASKKNSSQAEKAVSDAKKRSSASRSNGGKRSSGSNKAASKATAEHERVFSPNTIIAIVSLCLFIFFALTAINPDGVLPKIILSIMLGLFGKIGFYFLIPATLYVFWIFTFARKTRIHMRGICVIAFVLICGCIYHLIQPEMRSANVIAMIGDLYSGGVSGATGGVVCGLIAELLDLICGIYVAFILLILAACLTLLGSMQITIFSLAKAIKNRPRDEEMEDDEEDIDPATVVVNRIANRRIEHSRQRRQRMEEAQQMVHIEEAFDDDLPLRFPTPDQ